MVKSKLLPKHDPQQPWHPWSVQIELVQGCNRACWFCGIQGWPKEKRTDYKFMDLGILSKVASELNDWLPRIRVEIDLHGEPTLHPHIFQAIGTLREKLPKASIQLQTNTEVWVENWEEWLPAFQQAGVNVLALNAYKPGLYDWWKKELDAAGIEWVDYFHGNSERLSINHRYAPSTWRLFLLDNLGEMNVDGTVNAKERYAKRLHNSGGSSLTELIAEKTGKVQRELPLKAKCSKVFREVNLSWDGKIAVCCVDWQDQLIIGDAARDHIRDIWYSELYHYTRLLLYRRRRDLIAPCKNCNDPTTRVGLIPIPQHLSWESDEAIYRRWLKVREG